MNLKLNLWWAGFLCLLFSHVTHNIASMIFLTSSAWLFIVILAIVMVIGHKRKIKRKSDAIIDYLHERLSKVESKLENKKPTPRKPRGKRKR